MQSEGAIRLKNKETMGKGGERERVERLTTILQVGYDHIWLYCGTQCVSRDKGGNRKPMKTVNRALLLRIPRLNWILLSSLRKPLNHRRVNNHSMTEAEARRAIVAYESVLNSSLTRMEELVVEAVCVYEKDTCEENKRLERIRKHKPAYNWW